MTTNLTCQLRRALCGAIVLTAIACGGGETSPPAATPAKASTEVEAPVRYAATLADGITFSQPGLPEFVASMQGFSVPEGFGRWTDVPRASITFTTPLPRTFTLVLTGVQRTKSPVGVVVGGARHDATFAQPWTFSTVTLPIETDGTATTITFDLGDVRSPKALGEADDARLLGLALASLKVTS